MPLSKALARGMRRAREALPLVVLLWFANAAFGLAAALVGGFWLNDALDASLATRTLAKDLDAYVFLELFVYHADSFRMLLVAVGVLAAFYVLLWCWFDAAIVHATGAGSRASLPDVLSRASFDAPVLLRLLFVAWLVQAALTALCGGLAWLCWRWTIASSSEAVPYVIGGAAVAAWALLTVGAVAVHDQARIRACRRHGGALAAYLFAAGFVLRRRPAAYAASFVVLGAAVLAWVGQQLLSALISTEEGPGIGSLVVVGDVFLFARMFVRVWSVAAQGELQRAGEEP